MFTSVKEQYHTPLINQVEEMADFTTKRKKNVRFSVNRNIPLKFKVSKDERNLWLKLVQVLQKRRNTGLQTDTFIYITKKYINAQAIVPDAKRNTHNTVGRNTAILLKVSEDENNIWMDRVANHGGTKVEAFIDMINEEYTFQDSVKLIVEK